MILNKKGVTPVVAIILLLLITVGVAGSANIFLGGFLGGAKDKAKGELTEQIETTQRNVVIAFRTCFSNGTIESILHNVGRSSIPAGTVLLKVSQDNSDLDFVSTANSVISSGNVSSRLNWSVGNLTTGTYDLTYTFEGGTTTSTVCTVS